MNTRIMQLLLYLSFILVTGCSGPDPSGTNSPSNISDGNAVVFNIDSVNPGNTQIPLPNVLATAANTDPLVGRAAGTPFTIPEVLNYVNTNEVGYTNAVSGVNSPIYIRFSSPVEKATLTTSNLKVYQITADAAGTENSTLGFADVSGLFKIEYTPGSTDVFLYPNFPLSPGTRYLYVVKNGVKDAASGKPVISSSQFELLKSKFELVGPFAGLEKVRANAYTDTTKTSIKFSGYAKVMDDLIAGSKVTSRDEIVLMGRFNTTLAGFVRKTVADTAADFVPSNLAPVESALRSFAKGSLAKSWTNSFVTTASMPAENYWPLLGQSATSAPATTTVTLGTIDSANLSIDPVVTKTADAALFGNMSGVSGAYSPLSGVVHPYRSGTTKALTNYYHTPRHNLPVVFISPSATATVPFNGTVVIFQHGISGQKENIVAVAKALVAYGYAIAAIDLPMHGALAIPGQTLGTDWSKSFLSVGYPLATRSNIQQAAFNLHRLEQTLKSSAAGLVGAGILSAPPSDVKYVGISLGSIVGAYYLAGNTTLSGSGAYDSASLGDDMKGFLSVPGGRLAYAIKNSFSFNDASLGAASIDSNLATAGIAKDSVQYNQFFLVTQSIVDPVDPATLTTPLSAGSPSRLAYRIAVQEAVGDLVIPNESTRYFGNALGGRGVLPSPGYDIAPGFKQLAYLSSGTTPSISASLSFIYTLKTGAPAQKIDFAAALSSTTNTPAEGYFQFSQPEIHHSFLINPKRAAGGAPTAATSANTGLGQTQMLKFLLSNGVVDPTP